MTKKKRGAQMALSALLCAAAAAIFWKIYMEQGAKVNAGQIELLASEEFPDSKVNALVRAVGRGDVAVIEASAKAGTNLDAIGAVLRVNPLMWGVLADKPDSVAALLRLGAKPNYAIKLLPGMSGWEQDKRGNTDKRNWLIGRSAISMAVSRNYLTILKLLLEGGADPNEISANPPSLFDAATELKTNEVSPMFELMLKHGGNFNLKNKDGNSLLEDLITTGKLRTAIYIVEKGADVHALNRTTTIPWSPDYYDMLKSGEVKEQPDDYYRYNYGAYQIFRMTGRDGARGDAQARQFRQMLITRGVKMETWDPINVARRRKEAGLRVLREEGVPDEVIKSIIRMNKAYEASLAPEYQEMAQLGRILEKEYLSEKKQK